MGTYWSVEECAWVEHVREAVPLADVVPDQRDAAELERPLELTPS